MAVGVVKSGEGVGQHPRVAEDAPITDVQKDELSKVAAERAVKLIDDDWHDAEFAIDDDGHLVISDREPIGRGIPSFKLEFDGAPASLAPDAVVDFLEFRFRFLLRSERRRRPVAL